jgi:inosine-uridine nucleoside N-ribohydrolase
LCRALAIGIAFSIEPAAAMAHEPVRLIFDTDIGNDIDDVLALGLIHALKSRGECDLLAVTISKDNRYSAPFVDLVNTFYGRGDIPIGVVRDGKTPEDGRYTREMVLAMDGDRQRWPHDLKDGRDAPEAVGLLRQVLARQPDQSVALVVVGFSTNIARLLDSPGDEHSPLGGRELCQRKCRLLSMMGGMFTSTGRHKEYNVYTDSAAARKVFEQWPGQIVVSGYEVGAFIHYPAWSIEREFNYVPHHPLKAAYELYQKMPYHRETWDLTSVLYAVRPEHEYFGLSEPGRISIDDADITQFSTSGKNHRHLTLSLEKGIRAAEAFRLLVSQPPLRSPTPTN